ncbi:MAG TPA: methionine--tRNA ligase [Streptosporangiaceae bacterium]
MTPPRIYLSTTIPYVNARPHLGHALELVQADVLARHHRRLGHQVRFQSGTDDNSLKNVLAAQAAGQPVQDLVRANGRAFAELRGPLALSTDDFIHTSTDPRHRPGVERLWQACAARGDLYQRDYTGLYCTGCEQFYKPAELPGGRCPEHGTPPEAVAERNWFFRLSRYGGRLAALIESGELRIEPPARRREVLAFIGAGLEDFSISRSAARARGWGIPVPGDPQQVIYVWWDALGNYITAPGYGTGSADYPRWWAGARQRIHLAGKGVLRFHAVYWPAILLSAGEPLPTQIVVHDYLTAGGRKISKSAVGGADGPVGPDGPAAPASPAVLADPVALAGRYGTDAVRWWLLREVPRTGDADFTTGRLVACANRDLANGVGNLVSRVTTLARDRDRDPGCSARPAGPAGAGAGGPADALLAAVSQAPGQVGRALESADFRAALAAIWLIVEQANSWIESTAPWQLARQARAGDRAAAERLDAVLAVLLRACRTLAAELAPFVPDLAARITAACDPAAGAGPVFPRLDRRL